MSLKQISPTPRLSRREQAELNYDQKWREDPTQFSQMRSARSRLLFERAKQLIAKTRIQKVCELGSGCGALTKFLQKSGLQVDAVDISTLALNTLSFLPDTQKVHAYVPYTPLPDRHYDLVLALDLIAELPKDEQRLCISECARLLKPEGHVLLSTPLDIYSEDPLPRFLYLVTTEFTVEEMIFSHHSLQIKLLNGASLLPPLKNWLKQSEQLLSVCEKISSFLEEPKDASHVIVMGKKKPLFTDTTIFTS